MKFLNFLILTMMFAAPAFGAAILQSKNNRILISLDGTAATVGQTISLIDADGKEVGTAVINQIKNGKAIASIKTGKSDGSETLKFPGAEAAEKDEPVAEDSFSKQSKNSVYRLNSTKVSILFDISMNTMITKLTDGTNIEDVSMKGTSIGVTGAFDYPMLNWVILRGTLGYEPFNAAGSAKFLSCDSRTSRDCNAKISYFAAGGFARFNLTKSNTQLWAGFGAVARYPISKASTALDINDVKLTTTFGGAFGVDYFISNKTYIPVSIDYQMFLPSDTVSGNMITLRAGYGWAF